MTIHATAIVDDAAEIGADVEIGPYAILGAGVVVGDRCRIGPHACLVGPLELGEECVVGFSAALGHEPQVRSHRGPFGAVRIGKRNVFREFSQVQRSMKEGGATVIGDDGYFMAGSHVAHDCRVGDEVTACNGVLLAGHVAIGDRVFLAGLAGVHQFVRVGDLAMVGGHAGVNLDVPPFCTVTGVRPKKLAGLNLVGLRRAGFSAEARLALKQAFRTLFRSRVPASERLEAVDAGDPAVARLVAFIRASKRGVTGLASVDE